MAEIRLSKLTKQFSIGLARLVDFLNEKGANVEMNPNAKISDEYLPAIEAKFGEDLKLKKDSEKVTIKLKEIIEMGSKKKTSQEDDVPEKEVVIKTNTLNTTPVKEERVEPKAAKPAEVQVPEIKEAPSQAGPKVVDKIDLSQFEKKPAKKEEKPAPAPTPAEEKAVPAVEPEKPVEVPVKEEVAPKEEVVAEVPVAEEIEKPQPREVKLREIDLVHNLRSGKLLHFNLHLTRLCSLHRFFRWGRGGFLHWLWRRHRCRFRCRCRFRLLLFHWSRLLLEL